MQTMVGRERGNIRTFTQWFNRLRHQYTREEWAVLVLAASLFCPLYVTVPVAAVAAVYLLWRRRLGAVLALVERSGALMTFAGLGIMVPALYGNGLGVLVGLAVAGGALLSMAVRRVMTRRLMERILDMACVASLACCAVAVAQHLIWGDTPGYRAPSVFYNPNYYATVIEFVVVFCIYKLTGPASRLRKAGYCLTLVANGLALYLCGCRTAWAAILLAAAVMLLIARRHRALVMLAACTVLFAGALQLVPELLPRLGGVDASLRVRQGIWLTALRGFAAEPLFGQGAMAYRMLWRQLGGPAALHAHNLVLDMLLSYGVVGVSLMALYLAGQVKTLLSRSLYRTDRRICMLMAGIFMAVLGHGMMDVTILGVHTGLLFAILVTVPSIYEPKFYPVGAWVPGPEYPGYLRGR